MKLIHNTIEALFLEEPRCQCMAGFVNSSSALWWETLYHRWEIEVMGEVLNVRIW